MVAAIWTRDGKPCHLDYDCTAERLPAPNSIANREGLIPADLAAYLDEKGTTCYCLLWSPSTASDNQRCIQFGITPLEWDASISRMKSAGFDTQSTLQVFVPSDNSRKFAGIWSTAHGGTVTTPMMEQPRDGWSEVLWTDISLAAAGMPPQPLDAVRSRLSVLEQISADGSGSAEVWVERAKAHYYLEQPLDALKDLTRPAAMLMNDALLLRALCRAQLGQTREAEEDVAMLCDTSDGNVAAVGQILTRAWLGRIEEARGGLDLFVQENAYDSKAVYCMAGAAAQISRIVLGRERSDAAEWKRRALELIRSAVERRHSENAPIYDNPDFAPLWDDPEFQQLVTQHTGKPLLRGSVTAGRSG